MRQDKPYLHFFAETTDSEAGITNSEFSHHIFTHLAFIFDEQQSVTHIHSIDHSLPVKHQETYIVCLPTATKKLDTGYSDTCVEKPLA